jgi:hypothetical protein
MHVEKGEREALSPVAAGEEYSSKTSADCNGPDSGWRPTRTALE